MSPFLADKVGSKPVYSVSSTSTGMGEEGMGAVMPPVDVSLMMSMRALWGGHIGNFVDDVSINRKKVEENDKEVNGNDDDIVFGPGPAEEGDEEEGGDL